MAKPDINPHAEDWLKVQAWAETELQEYTRLLIAAENPEIRGRIKQLQQLLELPGR